MSWLALLGAPIGIGLGLCIYEITHLWRGYGHWRTRQDHHHRAAAGPGAAPSAGLTATEITLRADLAADTIRAPSRAGSRLTAEKILEHKALLEASIYGIPVVKSPSVPPGTIVAIDPKVAAAAAQKTGGLIDFINANIAAELKAATPAFPTAIGKNMLAISGGRQMGKTAAMRKKVLRPGSSTAATLVGWSGASPSVRAKWGRVTILKLANDPLWQTGDILRVRRTGENMAVVHAPTGGVLYVTRGIGSIAETPLQKDDVIGLISTASVAAAGQIVQYNWNRLAAASHYGHMPGHPGAPIGRGGSGHVVNHRPGLQEEIEEQFAIEPVVAWRAWTLATDDCWDLRLCSVSHSTLWPAQEELVATCSTHGSHTYANPFTTPAAPHEAPVLGCACGIYLTAELAQSVAQAKSGLIVVGVVRGWGKTIKHRTGWRVQKAYPVGLFVVGNSHDDRRRIAAAEKLQNAYAVPTLSGPEPPKSAMKGLSALDFALKSGWVEKEGAPDAGK